MQKIYKHLEIKMTELTLLKSLLYWKMLKYVSKTLRAI